MREKVKEITLPLKPDRCPFCRGRLFEDGYSCFCLGCYAQVVREGNYYRVIKREVK